MENKKIIIGGGIAGLIYALYNPEFIIITDKVGGQFNAPFQLGPRFLHATDSSKRFLKDINVEYPLKKVKVGFYYNGEIHSENTEENRKKYFEKTRGITAEPYKSSMSDGSNEFDAYDVGPEELVKLLEEKLKDRIIIDKISNINLEKQIVKGDKEYEYEELVITIPRSIFYFLVGRPDDASNFKSLPTSFYKVDTASTQYGYIYDYDYVYYSESQLYHRITNLQDGSLVIEYKGIPAIEGIDKFTLKIGQIIERNDTNIFPDNISFFGRFATWKHKMRINDLLDIIYGNK